MLHFNFQKLSEQLKKKLEEDTNYDDSLREICKRSGLHPTFLVRILHYDKYKVENCQIKNLFTLLGYFELDINDFVDKD